MFKEDKTKFHDPAEWLDSDYTESPIFNSFDEIWDKIKDAYNTDFRLLVHGEFPEADLIKTEVHTIIEGLKK